MTLTPDLTFNIHPTALIVARLISIEVPAENRDHFRFHTFPFYNGREKGICLIVSSKFTDTNGTFIVFGENRNSDNIFIDVWKSHLPYNCPTTEKDFTDEAYENRKFFDRDKVHDAARFIESTIKEVIQSYLEITQ
jgi:hypothetical protein